MPSRIRISKNLINQPNIMRTPTPPAIGHHHHQQQQQQLLQHHQQQQYEYYKQNQRFYNLSTPQLTPPQQQQQQPQQQPPPPPPPTQPQPQPQQAQALLRQQQHSSPTPSSTHATGLNLTTNNNNNNNNNKNSNNKQHALLQPPTLHAHLYSHGSHQQNGMAPTHMGTGEFELSTDTDDDSLNGEPDSSNMLAPWELAVEALRDTRPKDRERILQLLQRLLHDNQQYRYTNLQLSELLHKRDAQVGELGEQLQHCRRQLEDLTLTSRLQHQQQQQQPEQQQQTEPQNLKSHVLIGGVISKADSCCATEELQVPLKKSFRRDPDLASHSPAPAQPTCLTASVVVSAKPPPPTATPAPQVNGQVKSEHAPVAEDSDAESEASSSSSSSSAKQRLLPLRPNEGTERAAKRLKSEECEEHKDCQAAKTDSEDEVEEAEAEQMEAEVEAVNATEQLSAVEESQSAGSESNEAEKALEVTANNYNNNSNSCSSSDNHMEPTAPEVGRERADAEDDDEQASLSDGIVEAEQTEGSEHSETDADVPMDVNSDVAANEKEKENESERENENENSVAKDNGEEEEKGDTPISAEATAGALFDSSNSSDASSMKQAQICASNVVAQITACDVDTQGDADLEGELATMDEAGSESTLELKRKKKKKDRKEKKEKRKAAAAAAAAAAVPTALAAAKQATLEERSVDTALRPMVTKASKKQTPTTNCDLQIKQELI